MPKKVVTRTGHPGQLPNDRRILAGIDALNGEPVAKSDGDLLNRNEFIHLLFKIAGTNPVFEIQIWWYSFITGEWHRGEALTVNNHDLVTIEVQGLDRIYLEVTDIDGTATPTLDGWLALVVPV